jgi:hypothetical protein
VVKSPTRGGQEHARTCVVHENVHPPVLPEHKGLELFYALIARHVQLVEDQLAHALFALCTREKNVQL